MLMAFPTGRLEDGFARGLAVLGYFLTTVLWWTILLFYDSTRDEWASNPLLAFDNQSVADTLLSIQSLLAIGAVLGVLLALRRRWVRSSRPQRQVLVPVYAAAAVLASLLLLSLVGDVTPMPDNVETAIDVAGLVSLMMVPFAFLGGLLRHAPDPRGRGLGAGGPAVRGRRPAARAARRAGRRARRSRASRWPTGSPPGRST